MTTRSRATRSSASKAAAKKTATKQTEGRAAVKKVARRGRGAPARSVAAPAPPAEPGAPRGGAQTFSFLGRIQPRPPASDARLAEIEALLGAPLPADYRAFLQTQNGGCPRRAAFDADGERFVLECYYHAGERQAVYELEKNAARVSAAIGRPVLAIAGDGSGDQLIYDPQRGPGLWWWRHDSDAQVFVAASFAAFDAMLVEPDDDAGERLRHTAIGSSPRGADASSGRRRR